MTPAFDTVLLIALPAIGAVVGWRMPLRKSMGQLAACPGLVLSPVFAAIGLCVAAIVVLFGPSIR